MKFVSARGRSSGGFRPVWTCLCVMACCAAAATSIAESQEPRVAPSEAAAGRAAATGPSATPEAFESKPRAPKGETGRYREYRGDRATRGMSAEQIAEMERLAAIGYVSGVVAPSGRSSVTLHDRTRAVPGLNFYSSGHASELVLTNMDGEVLHTWRVEFAEVWPTRPRLGRREYAQFIRRAHLFENGDVLAIWDSVGIAKLDRDSKVLWANPNTAHHDLEVQPNGEIYTLTSKVHLLPRLNAEKPVREDFVSILDAGGREIRSVSLLEAFENSDTYRDVWLSQKRNSGELFHTNSLMVLDGGLSGTSPAFKKGRVLTSMWTFDTIAVVDLERPEVMWAYRGGFVRQHDPKILDNARLLLFDNIDAKGVSRVEEYDPVSMELLWSHAGTQEAPFYSRTCGAAQRLSGGNTLITESDAGRVFEVTRDHEIVWEFYNPHFAGDEDEFIAVILEMQRLPVDFPVSWAHAFDGDDR